MWIIRVYPVMQVHVLEISCVSHGDEGHPAGHLIFRTELWGEVNDAADLFDACSDALNAAGHLCERGQLEMTDDCCLS